MTSFTNSDGLFVHVGAPDTKNDGATSIFGNKGTIEYTVNFNDFPGVTFTDADSYIPAGSIITSCLLLTDVAWVGGTNVEIGTYQKSGTAIDADGIDAAILTAALTAGSVIVNDGALAANKLSSATLDSYIGVVLTGTYTAGKSRLIIEYYTPRTLIV
jgi:hypothetical protein